MVTSARGSSARMARVSRSLMAETRSSGSVRLTATARSTHPLDADDAGHLPRDRGNAFADAFGRRVGQGIDGAPAEPPAGNADENRDHDRRRGIGPRIAERDAAKPDQHRDRRPHVGAEMQRVGFERLAGRFLGDATQCAGAKEIDHDGAGDDGKRRDGCFDGLRLCADQPPRRFPDHDDREQEQQSRFGKRGDALDLAVTVLVLLVGRLAGEPHREIGQHRRREVDQRMAGLRQYRQRAGQQANDSLRRRKPRRGGDRSERDPFLDVHRQPLAGTG